MIEHRKVNEVDGIEIYVADSALAERFTHAELDAAFDNVKNEDHWKGPIDAIIRESERDVTAAAIEFYTGTEATFAACEWRYGDEPSLRVTAPGYWAGPCV